MVPLGLDPFKVRVGVLSTVASRTPSDLKGGVVQQYVSGVLTAQKSFFQKYGYFEIRAKIPLGIGVWPAFWLLANDGSWPPEIDAMERRGQRPGDVVMTTHRRIPAAGFVESCGFDFSVPNAWADFRDHGVLWEQESPRLLHRPEAGIEYQGSTRFPMYMTVNLAMGAKNFGGVGIIDAKSPATVEFQIDRISSYQIDPNLRREADTR